MTTSEYILDDKHTEDELKYFVPADASMGLNLPSACEYCSSNPKNGGIGVCNCTLGCQVVY